MAVSITGRTSYGPRIVRDGLVLYLDAANTKSYPGSGTTWNDLSGNSYIGVIWNGATFNSGNGGSLVFDGVDDYIGVSSPSSRWSWTPSGSGLNTMTIDVWIKTTDTVGQVVSKPWNGNGEYNYWIRGGNEWFIQSGGSTFTQTFSSYATGNWENITCIVTPTQSAVYRNGIINVNFANHGLTGNIPTFGNINLDLTLMTLYPYGVSFNFPTHAVTGNLAMARVYNRVLTASEVLQNYNAARARFV